MTMTNPITSKIWRPKKVVMATIIAGTSLLFGCSSSDNTSDSLETLESTSFNVQLPNDLNNGSHALLNENPGGPGGSPNQSLRSGDLQIGDSGNDLLIGGLGVDILIGQGGDDILIGGTEDFNSSVDGDGNGSDNRDRAFGQDGDDVFIWAPGDGSDFFDGGDGIDVVIFGILGENTDANGSTSGAPFFNVNPSDTGSQDFDGIYLDENNNPQVRVSNTPGFCSIVDTTVYAQELDLLNLDHIIRFSLRGIANAFDDGERSDDDGLRVALSIKDTEFLVCTRRDLVNDAGLANVEVFDIRNGTPILASIEDLPSYVQNLIQ